MKKVILITLFLTSGLIVSAQQGSWYVGGVVGFNSSTSKTAAGFKTTYSDWAFAPEVGTFLKDDIQVGAFLGMTGASTKNDAGKLSSESSLSPTVYARKFFKVADNFSTFAGVYLTISTGSNTIYSGATSSKTDHFGFGTRVGIGVAYALSPRFTAVGQYGLFGFQTSKYKLEGEDAGSDSSFDFGVNTVGYSSPSQGNGSGAVFNIGIYYTFKQP
jgi:hypothetical protein